MRFEVSSGSGQVLATGALFLRTTDEGDHQLCFQSDRGTLVEGGIVSVDGDLSDASEELFRQFFRTWGVMGIQLTSKQKT